MQLLAAICLFLVLAGGDAPTPYDDPDTWMFETLTEATQTADLAAYPALELVLRDMAEQRYLYSLDTRQRAYEYLTETQDQRALPWLLKIARIDIDPEPERVTLDRIAVRGALSALIELDSEDAVELNLHWLLEDNWTQTAAMRNLEKLGYWEATSEVETVFCTPPKDDEDLWVVLKAAEFLESSPLTTVDVCPCIAELQRTYETRLEQRDYHSDRALAEALQRLDARLDCINE